MPRFRVSSAESTIEIGLRVNLHPSHITAQGLRGYIDCELDSRMQPDLRKPYRARLSLPVKAITSGNPLQDREMRRRLAASRHPSIGATVTYGERAGAHGRYRASAKLTLHGVTREVTAEVRIAVRDSTMTVDGEQVIDMQEFGVDPPRLLVLRMEPQVDVRAHIVAALE